MVDAASLTRWSGGLQWIADPDEFLQRASHAVEGSGGIWLIDPVAASGVETLLEAEGDVQGIVLTVGRHERDATSFANRYDVSVHLPSPSARRSESIAAPTESIEAFVSDTDFQVLTAIDRPFWREVALYAPHEQTLIVGDALGTAPYFSPPGEQLSVHPLLRLTPPRTVFGDLEPERVLVGHGHGLMREATPALAVALRSARRGAPRAYLNALWHMRRPWDLFG